MPATERPQLQIEVPARHRLRGHAQHHRHPRLRVDDQRLARAPRIEVVDHRLELRVIRLIQHAPQPLAYESQLEGHQAVLIRLHRRRVAEGQHADRGRLVLIRPGQAQPVRPQIRPQQNVVARRRVHRGHQRRKLMGLPVINADLHRLRDDPVQVLRAQAVHRHVERHGLAVFGRP